MARSKKVDVATDAMEAELAEVCKNPSARTPMFLDFTEGARERLDWKNDPRTARVPFRELFISVEALVKAGKVAGELKDDGKFHIRVDMWLLRKLVDMAYERRPVSPEEAIKAIRCLDGHLGFLREHNPRELIAPFERKLEEVKAIHGRLALNGAGSFKEVVETCEETSCKAESAVRGDLGRYLLELAANFGCEKEARELLLSAEKLAETDVVSSRNTIVGAIRRFETRQQHVLRQERCTASIADLQKLASNGRSNGRSQKKQLRRKSGRRYDEDGNTVRV